MINTENLQIILDSVQNNHKAFHPQVIIQPDSWRLALLNIHRGEYVSLALSMRWRLSRFGNGTSSSVYGRYKHFTRIVDMLNDKGKEYGIAFVGDLNNFELSIGDGFLGATLWITGSDVQETGVLAVSFKVRPQQFPQSTFVLTERIGRTCHNAGYTIYSPEHKVDVINVEPIET